ncbi:hypothetical protein PENTCL1PPCAC_21107, partial [Pristionchus entomophagus]
VIQYPFNKLVSKKSESVMLDQAEKNETTSEKRAMLFAVELAKQLLIKQAWEGFENQCPKKIRWLEDVVDRHYPQTSLAEYDKFWKKARATINETFYASTPTDPSHIAVRPAKAPGPSSTAAKK